MFEFVILALSVIVIGAACIFFAAAFAAVAATSRTGEEAPSRFASPAVASLWNSVRVAAGATPREGLIEALVRSLMAARASIRGLHRDATS